MVAKFFPTKTVHNKSGYSIGGDVTSDRNYKRERQLQSTPIELAKNAARKRARRTLEKNGAVTKGDGRDVDHRDGNPMNNSMGNLSVKSKTNNRSFPRNKNAGKA
jgi:hypothetical protein|tara:strand:+ start:1275 stop:1589 length:315 start_codon:yes stop_codon:yes gene_type:complete